MAVITKPYIRIFLAAATLALFALPVQSQSRISGFVRDKLTGEKLIGANILIKGDKQLEATDNNGWFSMVAGIPCSVEISFVGYKTAQINLVSHRDTLV